MPNLPRVPFVPSSWDRLETMITLANVTPGQKTLDLGAGDGRVVIAMAKLGADAYGYEIDPDLVEEGMRNIKNEGLENKAFILNKDYWNENLSSFDIVTIYGMTSVMEKLEKKLRDELKSGAKVISNYFTFPTWPHVEKKDQIYVYHKY